MSFATTPSDAVDTGMQELLGSLDPTDSDTLARLQTVITECALAESRSLFQEITADSQNEEIAGATSAIRFRRLV